jgi:hypothetical protein
MTLVDLIVRIAEPPTDAAASALADIREVYGIRRLSFERGAGQLRIEYDASRLSAAAVASLVRQAGVKIAAEEPENASAPAA